MDAENHRSRAMSVDTFVTGTAYLTSSGVMVMRETSRVAMGKGQMIALPSFIHDNAMQFNHASLWVYFIHSCQSCHLLPLPFLPFPVVASVRAGLHRLLGSSMCLNSFVREGKDWSQEAHFCPLSWSVEAAVAAAFLALFKAALPIFGLDVWFSFSDIPASGVLRLVSSRRFRTASGDA